METIHHFTMECNHYNKKRFVLYCESMKILIQYQMKLTIKNILFPPINMSYQHRKHLYDLICSHVLQTKQIYFNLY